MSQTGMAGVGEEESRAILLENCNEKMEVSTFERLYGRAASVWSGAKQIGHFSESKSIFFRSFSINW